MLRRRMRALRLLAFVAVAGVLIATLGPSTALASPAMPDSGPPPAHRMPELSATSGIAVDLTSGLALFAQDADVQVPPASTMKIVTVLVARAILAPEETIEIQESDLYLGEDYSQMGLWVGDLVTVETLFYGAMLSSGADASLALARVAGQRLDPGTADPVGRFVAEMNRWARDHGMFNTNFTNPVGYDDDNHYTTARDLVRATKYLLDDALLTRVMSTPEVILWIGGPDAREMYLYSTNELVLSGDAIGGKTGTEVNAGQCLVNIVRRGGHVVVTVVMGSHDRYGDTWRLLDDVDQRVRFVVLGRSATVDGVEAELEAHGLQFPVSTTLMMSPDQAQQLSYRLELSGNQSDSGRAGVVVFLVGQREVLRLPVHGAH